MNNSNVIGLDIAKNVFQICQIDHHHKVVFNKAVRRNKVLETFSTLSAMTVTMEGCASAHYWASKIKQLGHEVRIVPTSYIRQLRVGNKHDANDALALALAGFREDIPSIPIKDETHLSLQMSIRIRDRHVRQRVALVNELRGLFLEFGFAIPKGMHSLRSWLAHHIEEYKHLEVLFYQRARLLEEWDAINNSIKEDEKLIESQAKEFKHYPHLRSIPGVGLISAASLVAAVPNPHHFKNGRHFSAWLGCVPRMSGTGGKIWIKGMSKRGNHHLRRLIVQCSNVLLFHEKEEDQLRCFGHSIKKRRNRFVAIGALSNKLARIIWAVMAKNKPYQSNWRLINE